MSQGYKHKYTSVYLINYHFIWIPRRRRPVLKGAVKRRLRELIEVEARKLGLPISTDMPTEIYQLMTLFPQPMQRRPSVQYVPVPYKSGRGERRPVPGKTGSYTFYRL